MRDACSTPLLLALSAAATLSACVGRHPAPSPEVAPPTSPSELLQGFKERGGLLLDEDPYGDRADRLVYLEQGWGPAETLWYYYADQGSVLFPYDLLVSLEQVHAEAPFVAPQHMARFRFLAQHATPNNPDGLPIGLARHGDRVGLTCAACHTGQINYQGAAMRIDGAPASLDMIGFLHEVEAAVNATLADEAKLARFCEAVARRGGGDGQRARALLDETSAWLHSYNTANATHTPEGFGRMDAIGRIVNQVIRFTSDPSNSLAPDAPASFPVLWDAPRHDYVQWVGFASNAGVGGLARNVGEVIGVFGRVEVTREEPGQKERAGYASTVDARALAAMEMSLYDLRSPAWPEDVLGPIDRALAARGAEIYQEGCVSCHAVLDRADPDRKVVAMVTAVDVVGTDPAEANLLADARIPTGVLEGATSREGKVYGAEEPALTVLGDLVVGVLTRQPDAAVRALAYARAHGLDEAPKQGQHVAKSDEDPSADLRAYKARPLNGVWASAPYLHNGSVPTLADLLRPPDQRPATFTTGLLEYDPVRVGFAADRVGPFLVDTSLPGGSNRGHLYGTTLSEPERAALLEYLKTL